jgi:hypothetical protein
MRKAWRRGVVPTLASRGVTGNTPPACRWLDLQRGEFQGICDCDARPDDQAAGVLAGDDVRQVRRSLLILEGRSRDLGGIRLFISPEGAPS